MPWPLALKLQVSLEGGYVRSTTRGDPGGDTFAGITHKTWLGFYAGTPLALVWPPSKEQADEFYLDAFWKPFRCGELPRPADATYLQLVANLPHRPAVQCLQNSVRVYPDGILAQDTMDAVRDVPDLVERLLLAQRQHYCDVRRPDDPEFHGLINRIDRVRAAIARQDV